MTKYEVLKPDYDRSLLSLSSSLLKHYGLQSDYPSLPEIDKALDGKVKNIVFLILDCMGVNVLKENLSEDSFLRTHMVDRPVSSVFPPTTTAATTAFHSGLSPYESGWLGWMAYFKEYDAIVELFRNTEYYTGKSLQTPHVAGAILSYESIYKKITNKNPDVLYSQVFPAFLPGGCETLDELCDRILDISNNDKKNIISAYWENPDATIHRTGVASAETREVMLELDKKIAEMAKKLPSDSLLIISADHGAIDVEEIFVNNYKFAEYIEMPPSLEARYLTFFVKEGCNDIFEQEFKKDLGEDFLLFKGEEFLNSGLLGRGKPHARTKDFIGDFVAISKSNKCLKYAVDTKPNKHFKGDHAGITKDEMLVPLILLKV